MPRNKDLLVTTPTRAYKNLMAYNTNMGVTPIRRHSWSCDQLKLNRDGNRQDVFHYRYHFGLATNTLEETQEAYYHSQLKISS